MNATKTEIPFEVRSKWSRATSKTGKTVHLVYQGHAECGAKIAKEAPADSPVTCQRCNWR